VAVSIQQSYGINVVPFTCPVCYDDIKIGGGINLTCKDQICSGCLEEFLKKSIQNTELLKCPKCMAFIPNRDVVTVLGNEIADKYSSIEQIVWRRNAQGVFHCKTPDCENAVFVDDKSIEWTCELCKKKNFV